MKKISIKTFLPVFSLCMLFGFSGCADSVPLTAQNGAVSAVIKRSDSTSENQKYVFTVAPNGSDRIYAERTTADDDADAVAYVIRALSATDIPYNALQVTVVPAYTNRKGEKIAAKATVRITEYKIDLDEAKEYNKEIGRYELGYEAPKTWFYNLTEDTHFTQENIDFPVGNEGYFSMNFTTSEKYGVTGEADYSDSTNGSYPLLQLNIVCPVKQGGANE